MSAKIIRPFPYELRAKPPAFLTRADAPEPEARESFARSVRMAAREIRQALAEAIPFRLRRLVP